MRVFKVNNVETLLLSGWTLSDRINSRTSFQATCLKTANVNIGTSVHLYDGSFDIFVGFIKSINLYEESGVVYSNIECTDNTAIADRRIVAFAIENMLAKDIIEDYVFPILQEEGITLGNISDGVYITKAVFNYLTCSKVMDYIVNLSPSYSWNIDQYGNLNYFTKGDYSAPFVLDSSTQHFNFKPSQNMEAYRNRQYVRGGKGYTSLQVDQYPTSQPDGTSRDFIFRYKVAKKPTKLEIYVSGNWDEVAQTDIGILNLDTGKKWYYSYDNNIITQDQSETPLTTSNKIRMSYYGLRNIFVITDDIDEIYNRYSIEGYGTGLYENMAVEKTLVSIEQVQQYANGLLSKYSETKDNLSFSTNLNGLKSGQLLRVTKPLFDIDSNFLIESVNMKAINHDTYQYDIKCLDGASLGGWENYFKTLINNVNSYEIGADETLFNVKLFSEKINYVSYTYYFDRVLVFPSDTLEPSDTLNVGELTFIDYYSERVENDVITPPA
jgi:hypothetical protein